MTGDEQRVVSASDDNTVKVWDIESGMELATFTCEGAALCCAFCRSTGVIAGDAGGRVYFLDLVLEERELMKKQAAKN
jgi:WD40 repeat protein